MSEKLKELQSQLAQLELGYRNCSSKMLYVKDEMENKDELIKKMRELILEFADSLQMYGDLDGEAIDKMNSLGIKYTLP